MDPACCRVCGADLGVNKKNWRSISGNSCCSLLTDIARNALSSESSLDVRRFEEGYVCRGCLRTVEKLHKLQRQVNELKAQMSTKVSQRAHHFQFTAACTTLPAHTDTPSASLASQPSRKRSRPASDAHTDLQHSKKQKKTLGNLESLPVSSKQSSSPDVAVSDS